MISWNCLGDSITDDIYVPLHYYSFIRARHPELVVNNYGIAGTRIGGHRVCGEDHLMMCRRYQKMAQADLITVWGGVNDWGQQNPTPMGTEDDETDQTFYGALKILCEGLKIQFSKADILFFTPIGNDGYPGVAVEKNEYGLTVKDYADAIINVCGKYDIPVLDLCRKCGFSPYEEIQNKVYFIDGLHLSVAGHDMISKQIESALVENFDLLIDHPTDKTVDLILFMGQSNMAGRGVTNESWPQGPTTIIEEAGYEYKAISDPDYLCIMEEPFGRMEENCEGIDDQNRKTGSLVTAFTNAYYLETNTPVVGVSASKGGSSILEWQPGTPFLEDTLERYLQARMFLEKNHVIVRHTFMVWCQGETDGDQGMKEDTYREKYESMMNIMVQYGVEKSFLINIGQYNGIEPYHYETIHQAIHDCAKGNYFSELVSDMFWKLKDKGMMKDSYHYVQEGYNLVGAEAGEHAGIIANKC